MDFIWTYLNMGRYLMGSPENFGQINRKFGVEFLGDSIENSYKSIENISNFA